MKTQNLFFVIAMNILLTAFLIGAFSVQRANAYGATAIDCGGIDQIVLENPPYGKLYAYIDVCKVLEDNDPYYDWYFYQVAYTDGMSIQSVPGIACGGQGEWSGSDWETYYHAEIFYVVLGGDLTSYDPTNTDGYWSSTATASVDLSLNFEYGVSTTYNIPYIEVEDHSDFQYDRAGWAHIFNYQHDQNPEPSKNSHLVSPAFIVKTDQNAGSYVDAVFYSCWAHQMWIPPYYLVWVTSQQFETDYIWVDGYYYGDE